MWSAVIDAMGKPGAGLLEGTVTSFGNVDECTDISVEGDGYDDPFDGKYCLLYLRPRFPPKPEIIKFDQPILDLSGTVAEDTVFEYLSNISAGFYSVDAIRLGICVPSNCEQWEIKPMLARSNVLVLLSDKQVFLPSVGWISNRCGY